MNNQRSADCLPDELPAEPMQWANEWLNAAIDRGVQPHPNAMTLATVGADGRPSSRVVLCKSFVPVPGYVVFYSNYKSRKSLEIATNPAVAVSFHWDRLGRQIRIEGTAVRSPDDESDSYFASRDRGSQLGAWGSDQSEPIDSREALIAQVRRRAERLGIALAAGTEPAAEGNASAITRPPHWGGFRVWASAVELWLSGKDRIHDRALWRRGLSPTDDGDFTTTAWEVSRLQP